MAHTPLPWTSPNGLDIQSGPFGALAYISTAGARGRTIEEAEGNCQFIIRAVNCHDDLLAALKGVLRVADRATDEFDAARAAIAKAETP